MIRVPAGVLSVGERGSGSSSGSSSHILFWRFVRLFGGLTGIKIIRRYAIMISSFTIKNHVGNKATGLKRIPQVSFLAETYLPTQNHIINYRLISICERSKFQLKLNEA